MRERSSSTGYRWNCNDRLLILEPIWSRIKFFVMITFAHFDVKSSWIYSPSYLLRSETWNRLFIQIAPFLFLLLPSSSTDHDRTAIESKGKLLHSICIYFTCPLIADSYFSLAKQNLVLLILINSRNTFIQWSDSDLVPHDFLGWSSSRSPDDRLNLKCIKFISLSFMGHGLNSQDMIFINSSSPPPFNNNNYKNETGSFGSPINSI